MNFENNNDLKNDNLNNENLFDTSISIEELEPRLELGIKYPFQDGIHPNG